MTKDEFMYVTEIKEIELEDILLLAGIEYPKDDWTEAMKRWYTILEEDYIRRVVKTGGRVYDKEDAGLF